MQDFREYWMHYQPRGALGVWRASAYTTIAELEFIAELLIDWLDREKALTAEAFYTSRRISPGTWERWLERCPLLQEAWDICVAVIGERRELGALRGEINASLVASTQFLYNKKIREWKLKLLKAGESASKTIVVVRDKMPDTPEVKNKGFEDAE